MLHDIRRWFSLTILAATGAAGFRMPPEEECDDGNADPNDGCEPDCRTTCSSEDDCHESPDNVCTTDTCSAADDEDLWCPWDNIENVFFNDVWFDARNDIGFAVGSGGTILRRTEIGWTRETVTTTTQLTALHGRGGRNVLAVAVDRLGNVYRWHAS